MREHEVPTHLQAEDRVLLWFTFQQLVAITAVAALSYGAYRYAPVGPSEVRIVLAVLLGLAGMAMIVGKVGGRRLPLVAADLLRFRLGPRRYAGPPAQLVRPEAPTPVRSAPSPLTLLVRKARRIIMRRRNGRMPPRPRGRSGKGRRRRRGKRKYPKQDRKKTGRSRGGRNLLAVLAVALTAAAGAVSPVALADDHHPEGIGFELREPVPGRRIYVERLHVSGDSAGVTVRAAAAIDLQVRGYGGPGGRISVFRATATLRSGETRSYTFPLSGDSPSLTLSWRDGLGQAGALSLKGDQIPYPLPSVEGELCDIELDYLLWTPGRVDGAIDSICEDSVEEPVSLTTVSGHESVTVTALMDADVTAVAGTVIVTVGGAQGPVPFVPNGFTEFRVNVPAGEAVHKVTLQAALEGALRIELPPLVALTHHPKRDEEITTRVKLYRPGTSRTVSETVNLLHLDGTTTQHVISATLSVPGTTVARDVTVTVEHEEHVRAEVMERAPLARTRIEALDMASTIGADDSFELLTLPEPEPTPEPAEQTPADTDELRRLFELLGWSWPW